jgi:ATP-dependent helicase HrpA
MFFNYPATLPATHHRDEIISALRSNQVVVVAGDTGSGKTTQIPKMCLEYLQTSSGLIGCTQPRRIAAQTVSDRVKEELEEDSYLVGYKIRFRDRTDSRTRIKFMTDGVLLAEARRDPHLSKYDLLMIDEAHERSLNIDFLLGHLKNILPKRPDLKVIITSATIDTHAFSAHFSNAPIINIAGKTYPVEVRYSPPEEDEYGDSENYIENCVGVVSRTLQREHPGDILVFLPTERDIRTCTELLKKKLSSAEILPLFGRLHSADQKKIFQPARQTKIVIATNVAETSITVPGIRYVVDSGLARIPFYNFKAKTNSLPIQKISQASCDQRMGRCGRVGPGICIRLYEEDDYLSRDEYSIPEIKRSNLAEVILQMRSFKLGDPYDFPFIDPPHPTAIKEGYRHLNELGAINDSKNLTHIGKIMASMPIDPCISRIVIEAASNNCLKEIVVVATVLAIQDPRIRPAEHEKVADEAHKKFAHPLSDFLSFLNIWNDFHHVKAKTSWSRLKKFCKANFLSFQRMREWIDLHDQMLRIIESHKQFSLNSQEASYDDIHKSLTSGFLRNIALKKKDNLYLGPSGKEVMIFPGSSLFQRGPQWLIASSFMETNRLYALNIASIQPEWLESLASRLCKYSWSEPRYHKKSGQVLANEQVSLFGLVIVRSRKVNFAKTNKKNSLEARSIFIQSALVEGNLNGSYPFLHHNNVLRNKWENVEDRLRSKDILVSDEVIYSFYNRELPEQVFDRSSLNRFLKKHRSKKALFLDEKNIVNRHPDGKELADFPPALNVGSYTFKLSYLFDPANEADGVTVRIPVELADILQPDIFEWIVPGLLREKTTVILKGLPKKIRKQFVPLNDTVDRILDDIELYKGSFYRAVEASIFKQFNITINSSDWPEFIPQHLRMRFEFFDFTGTIVSSGREFSQTLNINKTLPAITKQDAAPQELDAIKRWESIVTKVWAFDGLPEKLPVLSKTNDIAGYLYPAVHPLADQQAVTIRFGAKLDQVKRDNRQGMRYLFRLQFSQQFKSLKKMCSTTLSGPSSLWLVEFFQAKAEAVETLLNFTLDTLFATNRGTIPSSDEYNALISKIQHENLYDQGKRICDTVMALLRQRREVLSEIHRHQELARQSKTHTNTIYQEYKDLLDDILPINFMDTMTFSDLEDCQRYMKSLLIRIRRAHSDYGKDRRKAEHLVQHIRNIETLKEKEHLSEECLEMIQEYQKAIQEWRLSIFSPEIKTKFSVSAKILEKTWHEILRVC